MPLAFERMTVFCRDLDASLEFYRDRLGLVPVEEKTIEGPAAGGLLQLPACRMRIALLATAPEAPVMLGLFEVSGVELDGIEPPRGRPAFGQTALVVSTSDFAGVTGRLIAAGTPVLTPALQYPKRVADARSPAGIYHEMIVYDPDGVLVSIMQIDPPPSEAAA